MSLVKLNRHNRYAYPFRLRALRRALQHISKFRDEIWVTTPGAVASHFAKINPAP
jgi:allantoinase